MMMGDRSVTQPTVFERVISALDFKCVHFFFFKHMITHGDREKIDPLAKSSSNNNEFVFIVLSKYRPVHFLNFFRFILFPFVQMKRRFLTTLQSPPCRTHIACRKLDMIRMQLLRSTRRNCLARQTVVYYRPIKYDVAIKTKRLTMRVAAIKMKNVEHINTAPRELTLLL